MDKPNFKPSIKPNPGSARAIARGCICPVLDNEHGSMRLTGGYFTMVVDCPLHGWETTSDSEEKDDSNT